MIVREHLCTLQMKKHTLTKFTPVLTNASLFYLVILFSHGSVTHFHSAYCLSLYETGLKHYLTFEDDIFCKTSKFIVSPKQTEEGTKSKHKLTTMEISWWALLNKYRLLPFPKKKTNTTKSSASRYNYQNICSFKKKFSVKQLIKTVINF